MADRRPSRGGPRAAGEYLGGLVEQCVRHWLGKAVPLSEERILVWQVFADLYGALQGSLG